MIVGILFWIKVVVVGIRWIVLLEVVRRFVFVFFFVFRMCLWGIFNNILIGWLCGW